MRMPVALEPSRTQLFTHTHTTSPNFLPRFLLTSISCSSSLSFLMAALMRTTGVASLMLLPLSSICVLIS